MWRRWRQHRAVADLVQAGALTGVKQIHQRQRPPRIGAHRDQHPLQPPDERGNGVLVEHIGVVFDAQTQLGTRLGLHRQRVMVVFAAGDLADGQFLVARHRRGVDRVVLVHEQGVEQLLVAGGAVDLVERQVLVLQGVVVGALQLADQVRGAGCRREGRPHRHRVDEQPDHRFRAGQLGRPTRNRGAEGDVMLSGQPAQQLREGALQHRADGGALRARQLAQRSRRPLRHPKRLHDSGPQPYPVRPADQGRRFKPGEQLTPRRLRRHPVPTGQPSDKAAVGGGRRQSLPVITGEYFAEQDRQRPAIHHDVVVGHHQPVPIWCGADQGHPEGRFVSQLTDRGAFGSAELLDLLVQVDVVGGQLDVLPHRRGIGRDDLHRITELLRETRRQMWMADDHRVHCVAQPVRVKRAGHGDTQLHRVYVVARLRSTGVEEQTLLERGQR